MNLCFQALWGKKPENPEEPEPAEFRRRLSLSLLSPAFSAG